ncbi:MAG: FAD-dependent oxidoreductase [Vampirovibrio sp.]|nr:FAD-dependent oxidoreductase [Vampirovibrio sp.]
MVQSASDSWDVLVAGDEVESILTAVSAARMGTTTLLVRRSAGPLGGLSTRGGLSYMDITPDYTGPLFQEFLDRCGVVRVALDPNKAADTLADMLDDAGVTMISGLPAYCLAWDDENQTTPAGLFTAERELLSAKIIVDGTPDAEVARQTQMTYTKGLGGLLQQLDNTRTQNFLGVSPVFQLTGVEVSALQVFEEQIRQRPDLAQLLKTAMPFQPEDVIEELLTRPTFAPPDMDYLDILNPAIGIIYHEWKHGEVDSYADAPIVIDGGNIARLPNGVLAWNGMVMRLESLEEQLMLSQGAAVPQVLINEMERFQQFLQEVGKFSHANIIPPTEIYVRQTINMHTRHVMTAREMITGGVAKEEAIGAFSYWLDLRGVNGWQQLCGDKLPKPIFNVGLDVGRCKEPELANFAIVSRAAGYSPLGQGAGRIVQHNALLGEGIGIAAAMAVETQSGLLNIQAQEVYKIMSSRLGQPLPQKGNSTWPASILNTSRLLKIDETLR